MHKLLSDWHFFFPGGSTEMSSTRTSAEANTAEFSWTGSLTCMQLALWEPEQNFPHGPNEDESHFAPAPQIKF